MPFGSFPIAGPASRRDDGIIYSMPKLQDTVAQDQNYVTYDVAVRDLKTFITTKIDAGGSLELLHE